MSALFELQLGAILVVAGLTVAVLAVFGVALFLVAHLTDRVLTTGETAVARWHARARERQAARAFWEDRGS